MSLFEYISDIPDKDNSKLLMNLGNYVSHNIVDKNNDPSILMKFDRMKLAERFLNDNEVYFTRHNKSVAKIANDKNLVQTFIRDIAIYIDIKIPYFYFIKKNNINGQDGRNYYKGLKECCPELSYLCEESERLEKHVLQPGLDFESEAMKNNLASPRQLAYLKSLMKGSGYILKVNANDIDMLQANKLIKFFKDDVELDDDTYKLLVYDI